MVDIVERLRGLPIIVTENGRTGISRMGGALLSEAADEIERLRWENANMEKLWGKSEGTWMEIRDKQDAEIERLREALQEIAKSQPSECEQAFNFKMIARAALKEKL